MENMHANLRLLFLKWVQWNYFIFMHGINFFLISFQFHFNFIIFECNISLVWPYDYVCRIVSYSNLCLVWIAWLGLWWDINSLRGCLSLWCSYSGNKYCKHWGTTTQRNMIQQQLVLPKNAMDCSDHELFCFSFLSMTCYLIKFLLFAVTLDLQTLYLCVCVASGWFIASDSCIWI